MKTENRLKKFKIIHLSKGKIIETQVEGYSMIVEENEFRNKNHKIIDEFYGIEFISYLR